MRACPSAWMCWTWARSACILRRAGLTHVQSRIFLGAGDRGLRLVRQADQPAARCARAAARRQARPEILNRALTSARMSGFGFVTFKDAAVASRVTACTQHTIDRRDVRARGSAGWMSAKALAGPFASSPRGACPRAAGEALSGTAAVGPRARGRVPGCLALVRMLTSCPAREPP